MLPRVDSANVRTEPSDNVACGRRVKEGHGRTKHSAEKACVEVGASPPCRRRKANRPCKDKHNIQTAHTRKQPHVLVVGEVERARGPERQHTVDHNGQHGCPSLHKRNKRKHPRPAHCVHKRRPKRRSLLPGAVVLGFVHNCDYRRRKRRLTTHTATHTTTHASPMRTGRRHIVCLHVFSRSYSLCSGCGSHYIDVVLRAVVDIPWGGLGKDAKALEVCTNFTRRSTRGNDTIFNHDDSVAKGKILNLVGDKQPRAPGHGTPDALVENVLAHVTVHRRERVVHDNNVGLAVERPSNAHALLLSAAEIDTTVANPSHVALLQQFEVMLHGTRIKRLCECAGVERTPKGDVGAQRCIHDPRLLRDKCAASLCSNTALHYRHFAKQSHC
eukprot:Opistho-2@63273